MKKDPYKLRAVALLLAVGFVGGMFLQYQAPGTFVFASHEAKKRHGGGPAGNADAFMGAEEAGPAAAAAEAPPPAQAAAAPKPRDDEAAKKAEAEKAKQELTPATLRGADALGIVVDNTLEFAAPDDENRSLYFASRGIVAESGGKNLEARLWSRDDDRLCRSLGDDKRECFYLVVRLNEQLQKGAPSELPERIAALKEGEPIGSVEGLGATAQLLRGNLLEVPGFIPLLEGKPGAEWTQEPDAAAGARSFVGVLLARQRRDADRQVTFFAPNGQVFQASRLARHTVSLWMGDWRRQGDLVCRALKPETEEAPRAEQCARPRLTDRSVEFVDAGPSWRSFVRVPWPDDEQDAAGAAADPTSASVVLGARGRKTGQSSIMDLR